MAGLYDLDPEAQVLDDVAIAWDDPDQVTEPPYLRSATDTLLGADSAARAAVATRSTSDTLLGADVAEGHRSFTGTATDSLLGADTATRSAITRARTATDTLLGADVATGEAVSFPTSTLLPGSAARVPSVPGPSLVLPPPLQPQAVYRAPYVPGPVLLVTSDGEVITAALYNLSDLSAPVVAQLDLVRDPTWQDLNSEPGAGSIVMHNDDPDLASFADDGSDVIICKYRNQQAFEIIPDKLRSIIIATNEEPEEVTTYSGLGPLGVLTKGILDPGGGPGRSPVEEDRHYGWPDRSFDHSGWAPATSLGTVQHVIDVAGILIGGFTAEGAQIISDQNDDFDRYGWPSRDVPVIWGTPGDLLNEAPPGNVYFYEEFTIAVDVDCSLYVGADDSCITYVDGARVLEVSGINWFGRSAVALRLSAGTHCIASVVTNQDFTQVLNSSTFNVGKYAWVICTEPSDVEQWVSDNPFLSVDRPPKTILAQCTPSNAKALSYPTTPPGQTVTKTFRIALEEAQARGRLPYVSLGFTDTNFTDGMTCEPVPDVGSKVGTDLLTFARELAATYIDISARIVNGSVVIYMWKRGQRGAVTGVELQLRTDPEDEASGNLDQFEIEYDLVDVERLLVRSEFGWTELDTGNPGGSEAPLEIGAPASLEEVERMANAALADNNSRRGEITAGLHPRNNAEAPYTSFTVGDYVLTPTGLERVVGITMSENQDDGRAVIKVSMRDLLLSAQARQALDVQKLT